MGLDAIILQMKPNLTHLNEFGEASMVDVSQKIDSERVAVAKGEILMRSDTLNAVRNGNIKKGNVIAVAKVAGIMAAKKTHDLIPLCHPLKISSISVDIDLDSQLPGVVITSTVHSNGKTGVEMEALTAVSIAALTIYDMAKSIERTMKIQNIRLLRKSGGQSGDVQNE